MTKFDGNQWMEEVKCNVSIQRNNYKKSPCIFSASTEMLKEYEDAYVPQIISIGPYHFGKDQLRGMETFKGDAARRQALRIQRATDNPQFNFDKVIDKIRSREDDIKGCYDKGTAFEGEVLLWMVARDACFILEFFRNHLCKLQDDDEDESLKDDFCFVPKLHPIFGPDSENPGVESEIMKDLIKLDNQIPLFILEDVLAMEMMDSPDSAKAKLDKLLRTMFDKIYYRPFEFCAEGESRKRSHILDIYQRDRAISGKQSHILDIYHYLCLSAVGVRSENVKVSKQSKEWRVKVPCAGQLKDVGVKFQDNGKTLDEVSFKGRTLTLVPLKLDVGSEIYIRNLMALENSSPNYKRKTMTAYVKFMYELCQTEKGVAAMIEEGVIIGNLWHDSEVFRVLSSCKRLPSLPSHDPFEKARTQLIKYYNRKFFTAAAKIWNEFWNAHGSKPWMVVGGFGATIVLFLTAIQVFCLFKSCGASSTIQQ